MSRQRTSPCARAGVTIAAAMLLFGCVNTSVKRVDAEPAKHAETEIPESELLNVNIAVFDPGLPDNPQAREQADAFPEVRRAEARAMPVRLRDTLQDTGFWGAVRVVPEPVDHSELLVTGEIEYSNGLVLELDVEARDATGRVWLDRVYSAQAAAISYQGNDDTDPFQSVYNRIADDLLEARRARSVSELREIRRASELRFAAGLAPDPFEAYLEADDGHYRVTGMPAADDPMLARVQRVRERDYAMIDALDQHYRAYRTRIEPAYNEWRAASFREAENLREMRQSALTRKLLGAAAVLGGIIGGANADNSVEGAASQAAILGGVVLVGSGIQKGRESEMHAQALEELGSSLESDLEPRTVELENQTVTLSGSAEAQYEEWQRLLQEIYAAETGFAESDAE